MGQKERLFHKESKRIRRQAKDDFESRTEEYRRSQQAVCDDLAEEMKQMSVSTGEKRSRAEKLRQEKWKARIDFLKQGEAKKHEIAQEELRRAEEAQRRRDAIKNMKSSHQSIVGLGTEAKRLFSQCTHKTHLDTSAEQLVEDLSRKAEEAAQFVEEAEETNPAEALINKIKAVLAESKAAVETLKQVIEKATLEAKKAEEARLKAEKEKAQREEEERKKTEAAEKLKHQALSGVAIFTLDCHNR